MKTDKSYDILARLIRRVAEGETVTQKDADNALGWAANESYYPEGDEVYGAVSDILNRGGGLAVEQFIAAAAHDHRTLQQAFTGLCFQWIKHCAELKTHEFDARNADSANRCYDICEHWKLTEGASDLYHFAFLPCI